MRIGIIGTGNMGSILTEALVDSHAIHADYIHLTNRTIEKALKLQSNYPDIHVEATIEEVVLHSQIIFLCVKPIDIHPLLVKINHLLTEDKCLISITSPISVDQLESVVRCSCVRVIPSITNRALAGVCLVTYGTNCAIEWKNAINQLLSFIGKPVEIDQQITRVASDIVSCGPAFFSYVIQKFIQAAVKETHISEELATTLATEMLIGMGALINKDFYTLPTLQKKVTVKGGVTGKGIEVLENSNLDDMFQKLYQATHKKYAEDLEQVNNQFEIFRI